MAIQVACSSCSVKIKVRDELTGKTIKCPKCGQHVPVPLQTTELPPRAAAPVSAPDAAGAATTDLAKPGADLPATQTFAGPADKHPGLAAPAALGIGEPSSLGGYRILRELGQGGMGTVYEAEDVKLKRHVALKIMKPEIARNEQHRERFLREARTAAKVKSSFICPIYRVGEDNGVPFIAMPFLKGEPLDAHLKQCGRLPIDEVVRIGKEVAQGLSAAHEAGLVHRDIKPANIWLEAQRAGPPRAVILDFGLARRQADDVQITQSGAIIGTPAFMSPEQARGDKVVDARTDLFSLGCVLYVLSTGELPFQAETTMGILMALATHEPTPPRRLVPAIPKALSRLILSLLEKRPADRPRTASEVITFLADLDADLVSPAREAIAPGEPPLRVKLSADVSEPPASAAGQRAPRRQKESPAAATGAPTRRSTYAIVGLIGLLVCVVPLAGIGAYFAFFRDREEPGPVVERPRNPPPPGPVVVIPRGDPLPGPVVWPPRNPQPPVPEVPAEPTGEVPAGWVVVRSPPANVTVAMPQQPKEETQKGVVVRQTALANLQKLTLAVQRLHPIELEMARGPEGILNQFSLMAMIRGGMRPGGKMPAPTRIKVGPWPGRQFQVPAPPIKQGGYLGVAMRNGPGGVLIQGVAPYTPAAEAGLKANDVLFEADGQPIPNPQAMANALNAHRPGDTMRLKVKRGPAQLEVNVTLSGRIIDQCMRVYVIGDHLVYLSGPARGNGPAPETIPFFKSLKPGNGGVSISPDKARDKFAKGRALASRGEWKAAAAEYARVLAAQPLDGGFVGFEYAAVLLLSGDQAGYRKVCAELLAKSDQAEFRPYHAARASTLAPGSVSDATLPGKIAARELLLHATEFWSLTQRGALACRAGRHDEAEALLRRSLAANPRVGAQVMNWPWLALLEHRRGNASAARTWLEKATKGLEEYPQGAPVLTENAKDLHLHNWLEAQVLRREVEALLAAKKP